MHSSIPRTHSGNYYSARAGFVASKLTSWGIDVPTEYLQRVKDQDRTGELRKLFSSLELTLSDWFDGRDYPKAKALIHFRPQRTEWWSIRILSEEYMPSDGQISDGMICESLAHALAQVVSDCDYCAVRITDCHQIAGDFYVAINGGLALRIEPITLEPFRRDIRDRVRSALKGARRYDYHAIRRQLSKLPGFKEPIAQYGLSYKANPKEQLLAFPGSWAFAMRGAMKELGIEVKQHQAQELAAVFLGASNWHQLTKHQEEIDESVLPVAVESYSDGELSRRYYRTPEEAIFAFGEVIGSFSDPIEIDNICLSVMAHVPTLCARRPGINALADWDGDYWVKSGYTDYLNSDYITPGALKVAEEMITRVREHENQVSVTPILYPGKRAIDLLAGIMEREEIPARQLAIVGTHALIVTYTDAPDNQPMQTALLRIYRMDLDQSLHVVEYGIAMYKAIVTVSEDGDKPLVSIRGDYGHHDAIEFVADDLAQVKHMLDLTHAPGLYHTERPIFL